MRNLVWGLLLVTLGALLLLDNLGYVDFAQIFHDYWPVILILWGLSLVGRHREKRTPSPPAPQAAASPPAVEGDLVHQSNVFGDIVTSIRSKNFKGGSMSTVFGDCTVDLTEAVIADGDHELRIHGVFGDSTITLPAGAAAAVNASAVFGELSIFGQQKSGVSTTMNIAMPTYASAPNRLKITVSRIFGSIRVA